MRKQMNKLYRLDDIIRGIVKNIPQLNYYNINRLFVRDKDWCPSVYTKVTKEIPTQIIEDAFYKVVRVEDNLEVVPYGTGSANLKYTKMSYDVSGSYFDLDMQLLEPGYMYELKLSYYVNGTYQEQPESFRFRVEKNEH